jgi:hypothetical protein
MSEPLVTVDESGMHLRMDALLHDHLDGPGRRYLALWLANQGDVFLHVVTLLRDGMTFLDPDDPDWRFWYPSEVEEGRALLDANLEAIAGARMTDLLRENTKFSEAAKKWEAVARQLAGLNSWQDHDGEVAAYRRLHNAESLCDSTEPTGVKA